MSRFIIVDCEAVGPCPRRGTLTEFAGVDMQSLRHFHAVMYQTTPSAENPAIPTLLTPKPVLHPQLAFEAFESWLKSFNDRVIMVSDNPAYDWQWINDGFWQYRRDNLFGHSARRIGDFAAGVFGDWRDTQSWKRFRITPHDHNALNDAMGNAEALRELIARSRSGK